MLYISLLVMNKLNQTESAIFFSLVRSLITKGLVIKNIFSVTKANVMPCDGRRKSPVHQYSAYYIFLVL